MAYWIFPTTDLYTVGYCTTEEKNSDSYELPTIGVEMGLASSMLVLVTYVFYSELIIGYHQSVS